MDKGSKKYIVFAWIIVMATLAATMIEKYQLEFDFSWTSKFFHQSSLKRIEETGKIRVLTSNNSNSYYLNRAEPMGFEYKLAEEFAEYLGVDLEVVPSGWSQLIPYLRKGKGDFVAAGMTITEQRKKLVNFSDSYMNVQQKLIYHKRVQGPQELQELAGKTIHVRRNTSYHGRLEQLKKEGINLKVILHDNVATEELIRMVAEEEIAFTVADSNIALLNRRYFPEIRIGLDIEEKEELGWAVAQENTDLLEKINEFMQQLEEQGELGKIYEEYYGSVDVFDYFDLKRFHERIESRLPKFKSIIKEESQKYGFDWRLIAAQVYQESHYNPRARSHTGVKGLMQVTLETAKEMGIKNRLDPQQSLRAGIKYLDKLYQRFDDMENHEERMLFALGSYNIGYGHIRDAQQIARKKGLDPQKWSSLKEVLPYLTKRKYYKKTRYGYARGREAVTYVERIKTYYDILKQKAKA